MTNIAALKAANAERWANCKLVPAREGLFVAVAKRLCAGDAKARYRDISEKTGLPWHVVAVIPERECSQDWSGSLAQGDPWNRKSVHVPAGRGPFNSWEGAAVDALVNCAPYAALNRDWSIGGTLTKLEEY